MNQLKVWMKRATPEQQQELAAAAGTSRAYLYHLAADPDRNYHREAEPKMAALIEEHTTTVNKATKGLLPVVYRTDLNTACRGCQFALKCLGQDVVMRSSFEFLPPDDTEGGSHD